MAYLLIEALPSQVVAQVRMPVNVSFVLDRSGSMKGDKIDRVRRATSRAMELLVAGTQQDFPVLDGAEAVGVLTRNDLIRGLQHGGAQQQVGRVRRSRARARQHNRHACLERHPDARVGSGVVHDPVARLGMGAEPGHRTRVIARLRQ